MKGGFIGAIGAAARVGATAARVGSTAARVGSTTARVSSVASRGSRTFSVAGKSGPVSGAKGFKPMPKPKPKPKPGKQTPKKKGEGESPDEMFNSLSNVLNLTQGQDSSNDSMMGPGTSSMGLLSAGLGAAGAFAEGASEGTSPRELDYAMDRGTAKGQKAAAEVASGLAALTSGSKLSIVLGKTPLIVPKHKKDRCPCDSSVEMYIKSQRDLPEGLKGLISLYYNVLSRCNCKEAREELANYILRNILKSNKLTPSGGEIDRSLPYIYKKRRSARADAEAAGGTRKKTGHAINKKSGTRKQQKTQFR